MDFMNFGFALLGQIAVAGAIYGGIRADIKNLKESVNRAHERIDNILEKG